MIVGFTPPLAIDAVKVVKAPPLLHSGLLAGDTEILGLTTGSIVMVIAVDVTIKGLAQAALLVICNDTCCPLVKVLELKVELLAPETGVPFIRH